MGRGSEKSEADAHPFTECPKRDPRGVKEAARAIERKWRSGRGEFGSERTRPRPRARPKNVSLVPPLGAKTRRQEEWLLLVLEQTKRKQHMDS